MKQPPKVPIYRARKTSRWEPGWLVGRPPGRPANGQNSDRSARVDRPVDRGQDTKSSALCRSTVRSTGALSREQLISGGRPCGRPAHPVHICAHRLTAPVDRLLVRSTKSRSTARAWQALIRDLKCWLFSLNKIPKIHEKSTKIGSVLYFDKQTCLNKIKTCYKQFKLFL